MLGSQKQHVIEHIKGPAGSLVFHVLVVLLALWLIKPVDALEQDVPMVEHPVLDVSADISAYDVPPIPIQDLIEEPDVVETDVDDQQDDNINIS